MVDSMADPFFDGIPILIVFGFILVFGLILFNVLRGVKEWGQNEQSPRLTVGAILKTKYTTVNRHHHHHDDMHHSSTSTTYYVTFEVESGDRIEFKISQSEYGKLAEGDRGKLTFQGTRFIEFERNI